MHLKRCKNSGKTVKKKLESRTIFLEDLKVGMKESSQKLLLIKMLKNLLRFLPILIQYILKKNMQKKQFLKEQLFMVC